MDNDLICNFKKCRKRLTAFAWVTSCSHIFCDEDGTREFNKCYTCPACETSLSDKFDIVRIDLQPSEQYKSMVLAGQRPEVIMEICSRAMSFWTYQSHQERTYQEYMCNKAKERSVQLEKYYEQVLTTTQAELSSLKNQISANRKELESTKKRFNEVSEKLMERNRQHQKLQSMYDALRRRTITPSSFDGQLGRAPPAALRGHDSSFDMPIATGQDVLLRQSSLSSVLRAGSTPPEKEFVLRPSSTPVQLNLSHQDLSTAHVVQNRFNMELGTPSKRAGGYRRGAD
ncbi:E3 ubiquitin-protein ligase CCNB1IP1-like [Branchiostoma lanceolatum]|uniref:E3 ubiquitin-protein ligase CCNB1IP1-like n=1 Tax=Branchiostoma lanceolatum TaxID=7740 RepID=UPI003451E74A